MQTIEQVQTVLDGLRDAGTPAPDVIRQLAPLCLGWPYVFGAWGEECVPSKRGARMRSEHPTIKSACRVLSGDYDWKNIHSRKYCGTCQWAQGARMYDCRGFTRWLLQQVGLDITGGGATSQYNTSGNWTRRGPIDEMPDVVCCVFRQKSGKMEHTGMHIGGGRVIHCSKNVQSGGMSGWTHYAIPRGLYREDEIPQTTVKPTLRRGSRGDDVQELQEALISRGYDPGTPDGIYGKKTETAVKQFQRDNGLDADGVVGRKTWAALETEYALYNVTAYGVTKAVADKILALCPGAEVKEVEP